MPDSITIEKYVWPGGYPMYYLDNENNTLCFECARKEGMSSTPTWGGVNWEDPRLYCDDCEQRIESAYAEDCANGDCSTTDCPICEDMGKREDDSYQLTDTAVMGEILNHQDGGE